MPGAGAIAFPAVALIAWLLVVVEYGHVRCDRSNPSQIVLLAIFVLLALTFTTSSPGFRNLINSYSLYGDLVTLHVQTFVICATASLLALLILRSYPLDRAKPRIYLRLGLIALALVVMITLFVTVDHAHAKDAFRLVRWYSSSPGSIAYLLVHQAIFAVTMLDIYCCAAGALAR